MKDYTLAGSETLPEWARVTLGLWIIGHAERLADLNICPSDCTVSFEDRGWGGIATIHSGKGDIPIRLKKPENLSG